MLTPLFYSGEKGLPGFVETSEHLLRDFGWQGCVLVSTLHLLVHRRIGDVLALVDERLPDDVVGLVVQILGGKGCLVYGLKTRAAILNMDHLRAKSLVLQ